MMAGHLLGCETDGYFRRNETTTECLECPPGYFSTSFFTDRTWNEWPLRCTPCFNPTGGQFESYQDEAGSTTCKQCPLNTEVLKIPAATIQHCQCKPGYYSPFTYR